MKVNVKEVVVRVLVPNKESPDYFHISNFKDGKVYNQIIKLKREDVLKINGLGRLEVLACILSLEDCLIISCIKDVSE